MIYVCIVACFIAIVIWWWITRDDRQARAEAELGLSLFVERITPENYQSYGLDSFDERSELRLGNPIDVSYVSDDQLVEFGSQMSLQDLIAQSQTRMYPVTVGGLGRVVIRVGKSHGRWSFDSVGEKDVARNLTRLTQLAIARPDSDGAPRMAIDVPSMNLCFALVGKSDTGESARVTPLNDENLLKPAALLGKAFVAEHPGFDANTEGNVSAREVFAALSATARLNEGLPPITPEGAQNVVPGHLGNSHVTDSRPRTGTDDNSGSSRAPENLSHNSTASPEFPKFHVVRRGECLATIAAKYYGKQIWPKIYHANKETITHGPDLIFPGQKLSIPRP